MRTVLSGLPRHRFWRIVSFSDRRGTLPRTPAAEGVEDDPVRIDAADRADKVQNAIHVNSLKVLLSGALRPLPSKLLRAPLKRP